MKMRNLFPRPVAGACLAALLAATSTHAAVLVTSIDFGNAGGTQSGQPSNGDGISFFGADTWNMLGLGNDIERSITTAEGPTFTFAPGGSDYDNWPNGGTDPLRRDYFTLNAARNAPGTQVPWTLSGLTPGGNYDLILYSQSLSQAGAFTITGFDAGNGVGNPVTNDTDGDGNFQGVVADGSGEISGTFEMNHANWHTFAGLQLGDAGSAFRVLPEPSTVGFLAAGLAVLSAMRRRKNSLDD